MNFEKYIAESKAKDAWNNEAKFLMTNIEWRVTELTDAAAFYFSWDKERKDPKRYAAYLESLKKLHKENGIPLHIDEMDDGCE